MKHSDIDVGIERILSYTSTWAGSNRNSYCPGISSKYLMSCTLDKSWDNLKDIDTIIVGNKWDSSNTHKTRDINYICMILYFYSHTTGLSDCSMFGVDRVRSMELGWGRAEHLSCTQRTDLANLLCTIDIWHCKGHTAWVCCPKSSSEHRSHTREDCRFWRRFSSTACTDSCLQNRLNTLHCTQKCFHTE